MKSYTIQEAADMLSVTYRWVQRLLDQGRLGKKFKTGYLISQDDIDNYKLVRRPPGRPKKEINNAKAHNTQKRNDCKGERT